MNKSAALFRASNIITMDYPLDGALVSALGICDEAVIVVDTNSRDDTVALVHSLAHKHRDVIIVPREWEFDRMWQERCWDWASEATDAEWLMFHDADEAIHEDNAAAVRAVMERRDVHLIRFPFIHLYATRNRRIKFSLTHNTRLGRRSAGYRMRNWCSDDRPKRPVCQMIFGKEEYNAHLTKSACLVTMADVPVLHYGWCRSAQALAISQRKHASWYAGGAGLEDGRIPILPPYNYRLATKANVTAYDGPHPAGMQGWFDEHVDEWEVLENVGA